MNSQRLRWEEWCFDQIGKEWRFDQIRRELIRCIHWEYARESPTIRALVARYGQLRKVFCDRLRRERKRFDAQLSETFLDNFPNYFPEEFKSEAITAVLDEVTSMRDVQDWQVALPVFATTFTGRIVLEPDHFPDTRGWLCL